MEAGWLKGYDCIKQSGTDLFDAGNIGIDHHGVVGIVDHKSRFGSARFFDILLFRVVDLHFRLSSASGIMGGEPCSFLESGIGQLCAVRADNHMGAGLSFGVEPPVVPHSEFKGQFIVLEIIFSDIHMKTVAADIVKRSAGDLFFFCTTFSADVACRNQFFLDLHEIGFLFGDL